MKPKCYECGDDTAELRVYPMHNWVPDEVLCKPCMAEIDGNSSFTDFPLVQPPLSPAAAYLTEAAKRRNGV